MIKSGMHIGSEVIGTTVNTLLFAYLGESLLLFSYLKMQKYSMELLLNSKILFQNCVSMFFGAIACVLVMPSNPPTPTDQNPELDNICEYLAYLLTS